VIHRFIAPRLWAAIVLLACISIVSAAETHDLPSNVQILTQADFRARNYMTVAEALRGHTSLKLEQDGFRGTRALLKIRGLARSEDVAVLLDGRLLNHEFDGKVDLSQIPIEMVERIEITRGGASSLYTAQASAGVVNIVTLRPGQKGLVADLETGIGRHGTRNYGGRFTARSNWGDMTYSPARHFSNGFSANEDFESTSHFGNFTRSFNGKGYWGAEYFYHESEIGVSNGTLVPFEQWNGVVEQNPSTAQRQRTQDVQHVKAFVAFPLLAGGTTYGTLTQSWRDSDERRTRGGTSLLDKTSKSTTGDLQWRANSTVIGYQTRALKRDIYLNPDRSTFENSLFAAHQWHAANLSIAPGLRYEHESKTGGFLAPRLALVYTLDEDWLLSGTVQRSHRIPSFDEYFSTVNATNIDSLDDEKTWSVDLGTRWSPTRKFELGLNGFASRTTDLLAQDAASELANRGEQRSTGMETELLWRTDPESERRLESRLNWTLQRAETKADETGQVASAMTPRHLLRLTIDKHMRRKMVFTNELRYQGKQFSLPDHQGVKVPGFLTWNARFALRILAADLYVAVDNITNTRYAEALGTESDLGGAISVLSPQPVRTYWTGVSIRFVN
jgi:outer membrane receptor protein involved in Fe transport